MTKTSRFNYIKRGLVGVCAATMLTGLCAGTAFATDAELNATTGAYGDGSNTTKVSATVSSQVSASIPTVVPAYIKTNGEIQFPNSVVISTDSITAMKITGVKATALGNVTLAADTTGNVANTVAMKLTVGSESEFGLESAVDAAKDLTTPLVKGSDVAIGLNGSISNVTGASTVTALDLVNLTWTITAAKKGIAFAS